jgi:membrane protein DedA with SNARE-associated domain
MNKLLWKNPRWQLGIGILFCLIALLLLGYLLIYKWESRPKLIRDIVQMVLFAFIGTRSLMAWQKQRKANRNNTNEKDL